MTSRDRTPAQELLYVVSHDLQAPVRHLDGYLGLLGEAPLEDEHRRHLESARANVERLQAMIDALLVLSRLETRPFAASDVDLGALATDVAGDGWTVEGPPTVAGDAPRLRRLLEELVHNAHQHGAPPYRIRGQRTGQDVTLVVSDGGRGFPARLCDAALDLFRILHSDRSHVGAGLTIAHRIALQHGGGLVVDAREDGGCRVTVTLRDAPRPRD